MNEHFDVVIVGARCSGATLATFVAREGARVLLLDKDAMPSDHVLSTHSISPPGMDVLDEVGVGEAVRSEAPPSRVFRMNLEGDVVELELPAHRAAYCPRRKRLDGLLQQAAIGVGAQFLDRARVISLLRREGRVCGVRAIVGETERNFTAELVVGADGRRSTVAMLTGAEEYLGYDSPRATYWGYWDAPDCWTADPEYRFDAYMGLAGTDIRAVFQTDHGQLLLGSSPPLAEAETWRANPEHALRAAMESDPITAPLVRDSKPDGKVYGTVKERFFFKRAAGAGWALVGDAGHHKEFLLGDGITEALIQARGLAAAIGEGTDAALTHSWRARDVAAIPIHFIGQVMGAPERPSELLRIVSLKLAREPALMARMVAFVEQRLSPFEVLPKLRVLSWVTAAALRGRWRVVGEMLGMGRQAVTVDREMRARRDLLAEAEAALVRDRDQALLRDAA